MTSAYFSLGSNLGDRAGNLETAMGIMGKRMGVIEKVSRVYRSGSWGYESEHVFYNCCVLVRTALDARELMEEALKAEREMGRIRNGGGYSDRIIDIDLLMYGSLVAEYSGLVLPHPRLAERRFVLLPLAELASDLKHPVSGKTIANLLESCPDPSSVTPV
jgi:2-amino-4-hydroxy-6-hydroxymethyldihydropteridine diphosphokinase